MSEIKLSQIYDSDVERKRISLDIENVPALIRENINQNFELREYQINAIARFIEYYENEPNKDFPIQLLFNMATGSGKTLIMVTNMLYLYEKGYRNFVFFVDKTNIIKKTIENFINKGSLKYLFNQNIFIDGQEVLIKKVESFAESSSDSMNIHFSTIAGLHSKLNNPKENSVNYGDFEKSKTVFISDEAHHINSETKNKLTKAEFENKNSWEKTVKKLVDSHKDNVLLEFTATIDWGNESIFEKYKDRVLFEYDLRRFREDGFSKDVFLLQSDSELKDRIIQSVIISQYRRKIASDYKNSLKPVILMKSKYANEGKKQAGEKLNTSAQNMELFIDIISNLKVEDLKRNFQIAKNTKENNIFKKSFLYFKKDFKNLIKEIQLEFSKDRLVDVSDDKKIEENQIKINNLEAENNEVRVVFAVDKLNEGWDVLNLFDIVRLYGTRDTGKATIAEAQLVGRGARYCPFVYKNFDDKYRRKFDQDENHLLRSIEQLHFHSVQNHRYIDELRKELIRSGIHKHKGKEVTLKVKDSFKKTRLFKKGYIWKNKRIINKREDINSIFDLKVRDSYKINIESGSSVFTVNAFLEERSSKNNSKERTEQIKISNLSIHTTRKALDRIPFFCFKNLQKYFPQILSLEEFIKDEKYLGGIKLEVKTTKSKLLAGDIFFKLIQTLEIIKNTIKSNSSEFIGSPDFHPIKIEDVVTEKTMYIEKPDEFSTAEYGLSMKNESNVSRLDLAQDDCSFYAYNDDYGTNEEKYLVKMIYDNLSEFEIKFKEVFLIRNQKIMEIFDFKEGRRFEPDYLLFLGNGGNKGEYYQLFIEPKGGHIEDKDRWKEEFLLEIGANKKVLNLFENDQYFIYGLPFYQETEKNNFKEKLEELIKIRL
ncbi:DEAD/DEAH box helicase family protein [bacterium]|jgi:type III restriction enzyme|nr:DEAD/DEAH box helicase family protein [bacterium]